MFSRHLYVDWLNTGLFAGPNDDVSNFLINCSWSIGRDRSSQLTGRSTSAKFTASLRNPSGRFSSFNAASPLYGSILPGRRIKFTVSSGATTTLFVGRLESILPEPSEAGKQQIATFQASGPFSFIGQTKVNVEMATDILPGEAINVLLDQVGWSAGDRDIDTGSVEMRRWWTGKIGIFDAVRDLEDTERGFFREGKTGKLIFEDSARRLASPYTVSQATFSDDPNGSASNIRYESVRQEDPLGEIRNHIELNVSSFCVDNVAVLWSYAEAGEDAPAIPSSGSVEYVARFPGPSAAGDGVAVDEWITPEPDEDYIAVAEDGEDFTSFVTVSGIKLDTVMRIIATNNNGSPLHFTRLEARGYAVRQSDPIPVIREDAASKAKYGERSWPDSGNGPRFLPDTTAAGTYADAVLAKYKDPVPVLELKYNAFRSDANLAEAIARDVSDRITVDASGASQLGINQDFFVERIEHTMRAKDWRVSYQLSPA